MLGGNDWAKTVTRAGTYEETRQAGIWAGEGARQARLPPLQWQVSRPLGQEVPQWPGMLGWQQVEDTPAGAAPAKQQWQPGSGAAVAERPTVGRERTAERIKAKIRQDDMAVRFI